MRDKLLQIRVDQQERNTLERWSKQTGLTMSDLVRLAIRNEAPLIIVKEGRKEVDYGLRN